MTDQMDGSGEDRSSRSVGIRHEFIHRGRCVKTGSSEAEGVSVA
jgi:hypothetical protein